MRILLLIKICAGQVRKLAPKSLRQQNKQFRSELTCHITCANFSRQGEILATYNDEVLLLLHPWFLPSGLTFPGDKAGQEELCPCCLNDSNPIKDGNFSESTS